MEKGLQRSSCTFNGLRKKEKKEIIIMSKIKYLIYLHELGA